MNLLVNGASRQNGWLAEDNIHPDAWAHEYFAQQLHAKIVCGTQENPAGMDSPAKTNAEVLRL
jgi:hypothetical protein